MSDQPADKIPGTTQPVSRRSFVGLALGAAGTLLAACGGDRPLPTESPAATEVAAVTPTETLVPSTSTPLATATATVTNTAIPPTAVDLPATQTSAPSAPAASSLPPTYTPVPPTPTNPPPPTATSEPTAPPAPSRDSLMAHWPAADTSRVVVVRRDCLAHAVWCWRTCSAQGQLHFLRRPYSACCDLCCGPAPAGCRTRR